MPRHYGGTGAISSSIGYGHHPDQFIYDMVDQPDINENKNLQKNMKQIKQEKKEQNKNQKIKENKNVITK